jgi:hypothetical protein
MYFHYTTGSTKQVYGDKDKEWSRESLMTHVPFGMVNQGHDLGLTALRISCRCVVASETDVSWHLIDQVSFDSTTGSDGSWYRVLVPPTPTIPQPLVPGGSKQYAMITLLCSPYREGAAVRYPTSASAWYWGDAASASIHQHGNVNAYPVIYYLAPLFYAPLTEDLTDFTGSAISFTRAASKTHGGVSYAINAPIYDGGLYIASDTSQDVPKWTPETATVKTIACQIKYTRVAAGGGTALTIWTAAKNKLTFDTSANTISWTDDTTTVTATFPTSHWAEGDVIDVVAVDGTSHAVSLIVHVAGGAWTEVHTGTLAAIEWPELTLGNLDGSISNLIEYPYALVAAEWEALDYSLAPLRYNNLFIANRYGETITKGSDGRLTTASSVDITGCLSGEDIAIGATNVTITQASGLAARWYVECKTTDV